MAATTWFSSSELDEVAAGSIGAVEFERSLEEAGGLIWENTSQ